jgi:hypothetical protein
LINEVALSLGEAVATAQAFGAKLPNDHARYPYAVGRLFKIDGIERSCAAKSAL